MNRNRTSVDYRTEEQPYSVSGTAKFYCRILYTGQWRRKEITAGGGAIWWCPGEGAGGGHPSRPARGYGGALQAPPSAEPQKPTLFALKKLQKLRKEAATMQEA